MEQMNPSTVAASSQVNAVVKKNMTGVRTEASIKARSIDFQLGRADFGSGLRCGGFRHYGFTSGDDAGAATGRGRDRAGRCAKPALVGRRSGAGAAGFFFTSGSIRRGLAGGRGCGGRRLRPEG